MILAMALANANFWFAIGLLASAGGLTLDS